MRSSNLRSGVGRARLEICHLATDGRKPDPVVILRLEPEPSRCHIGAAIWWIIDEILDSFAAYGEAMYPEFFPLAERKANPRRGHRPPAPRPIGR